MYPFQKNLFYTTYHNNPHAKNGKIELIITILLLLCVKISDADLKGAPWHLLKFLSK